MLVRGGQLAQRDAAVEVRLHDRGPRGRSPLAANEVAQRDRLVVRRLRQPLVAEDVRPQRLDLLVGQARREQRPLLAAFAVKPRDGVWARLPARIEGRDLAAQRVQVQHDFLLPGLGRTPRPAADVAIFSRPGGVRKVARGTRPRGPAARRGRAAERALRRRALSRHSIADYRARGRGGAAAACPSRKTANRGEPTWTRRASARSTAIWSV